MRIYLAGNTPDGERRDHTHQKGTVRFTFIIIPLFINRQVRRAHVPFMEAYKAVIKKA
jgi:hypothetical protein